MTYHYNYFVNYLMVELTQPDFRLFFVPVNFDFFVNYS